ncbi:PAS domain-containing sensor histidine kinase [Novispirillum itersonii]|uniref:histidine kinase n=1 Tax=Novispirillum itersonii TaxID=189 RepID=A0A7W9ZIS3_NOVIT|nr:PAS domain-containing sensor histidine kinase [Novispirillum itersonii]MBB6212256.1 PAS domain S-box-containing protein [Novispirillum itersonii]
MEAAAILIFIVGVSAVAAVLGRIALRATRQKQQQDRLIDRLEDCLTLATDWVWECDTEGRFTYFSQQIETIMGLPANSLIGKTRREIAGTPSSMATVEKVDAAMKARAAFSDITYSALLPDGTLRHMRISGKPIYQHGQFIGYRGIGSDVTQQVNEREAAQSAEVRLRIAIEGIPEGFALCSIAGIVTMRNRRLGKMVERAGGHIDSEPTLRSILTSCAEDPQAIHDYLDAWYTRVAKPMEFRCRTGLIYVARTQISPDNSILLTLGDVSEQRRAQDAEKRLEEERRQAQKLEAIGTLAGGIAHEINTPIQYIGDNVRFVASLLPDLLRLAEEIRAAQDSPSPESAWGTISGIVNGMDLDFVREEAPLALEQTLEGISSVSRIVLAMKEFSHPSLKDPVPFDLNRNIENTVTISRNEWKIVATVDLDLDPAMPPVTGLPGDLNQVFLNMVVNAAHAIEDAHKPDIGVIRIRTRRTDDLVTVSIADTGCGIPEENLSKIFEPFFTTKDVGRGSGQGLAIAHDIVTRKHGGRIAVDSIPGEGTTFTITIPLDCSTLPQYQAQNDTAPGPVAEKGIGSVVQVSS